MEPQTSTSPTRTPRSSSKSLLVIILLALFILLGFGTWYFFSMNITPTVNTLTEDTQQISGEESVGTEELSEAPVNAAYGRVSAIQDGIITLEIITDNGTVTLYFESTPQTIYSRFAFANDDDLIGTETTIDRDAIAVNDSVTVYTDEEVGSVSPQKAVRVVKVIE